MSGLGDLLDEVFIRPQKEKAAKTQAEEHAKLQTVDAEAAKQRSEAAIARADEDRVALATAARKLREKEREIHAQAIGHAMADIAHDRLIRGKRELSTPELRSRAAVLVAKQERGR